MPGPERSGLGMPYEWERRSKELQVRACGERRAVSFSDLGALHKNPSFLIA